MSFTDYFLQNRVRILILAALHFTIDFYAGLTIPLPEPTLVNHLQRGLPTILFVTTLSSLICNIVQPVAGSLMHRDGHPWLLLVTPPLAALTACVGLVTSLGGFAALFCVAFICIGIVHPEAAWMAQSLTRNRKGLATACFMSGGFIGYSTGALVGAWWASHHGLAGLWCFSLPALLLTALIAASGLHRRPANPIPDDPPSVGRGKLPFLPVFLVAMTISASACVLTRLYPVFAVRTFGVEAQAWGGLVLFSQGIVAAFMAYVWGHRSDRRGCGSTIRLIEWMGLPFFILLILVPDIRLAPLCAIGIGMTAGAAFPLSVVLARHAHGLPPRFRMGLCIGGSWAIGELVVMLLSLYIGRFPDGAVEALRHALYFPPAAAILIVILASWLKRWDYGTALPAATMPGSP